MSIRDRISNAIQGSGSEPPFSAFEADSIAEWIVAACPEIAALDHAREGWLRAETGDFTTHSMAGSADARWRHMLVIPKPEASS